MSNRPPLRASAFADDLPAGQIRFVSNFEPGIHDGKYTLQVDQKISATGAIVPELAQSFVVSGPRFALDPADIYAQYPPAAATGQFAEVLPHVVMTKRLLPWERLLPPFDASVPWLALLVFEEGELLTSGPADPALVVANYAETMTVSALLAQGSADVRVPHVTPDSQDEANLRCQVVTISNTTFATLLPTARELPFLAHGREVDMAGKAPVGMPDNGLFSVVVGNRFALPGTPTLGAKCIVHLVTLEGFGDLLGGAVPLTPTQGTVKLVSLYSWNFSCLPDPQQSFGGLAQNLAYDSDGTPRPAASLMLRLPFASSGNTDPVTVATEGRLSDGYAALGYHARTGEDGFAWFRGALAPSVPNPISKSAPFKTASAAIVFESDTGVFDHSLAAAWQCGRSLALADQGFAEALMRLRQTARNQLQMRTLAAADLTGGEPQDGPTRLAALFGGGALRLIARPVSLAAKQAAALRRTRAPAPPPAPVTRLRRLLAQHEVRAALAGDLADDPDAKAVALWLGQLMLLQNVPFEHLVPDARMLPAETLRFFYADPNWIGAMVDGALAIGLGSSEGSAIQDVLTDQLESMAAAAALAIRAESLGLPPLQPADGPTGGLLIRSALISGWPGITVSGTAKGIAVDLLRLDVVAPNVLFCLFNGVPDTVALEQPHEGLEFGVDDKGQIVTRTVSGSTVTDGAEVVIYDPQAPDTEMATLRAGGQRVLNVNSDPNFPTSATPGSAVDLLTSIAVTLNTGTAAISVADFAIQMVKGPEELTFSATPPSEPPTLAGAKR